MASSLAVFQFLVVEINTNVRIKSQMRYDEYKQFFTLIEAVPDTLNTEMMTDLNINPHDLVVSLTNQINRIDTSITAYSNVLFPGLGSHPESVEITGILGTILIRTDEFRKGYEGAKKIDNSVAIEFLTNVQRMNWHNDMRDHLRRLHRAKHGFYRRLNQYM